MKKTQNLASIMENTASEKNKLRGRIEASKSKKLTKVIVNTSSRYIELLENEKEMKEVFTKLEKSLENQREIAGLFEEIEQLDINTVPIKKRPSKRFYNLQEVFSDPKDYYGLKNEEKIDIGFENALIEKIIINAENINDDFLINLGLEDNAFKELPYHKRLSKKIDNIPKIKKILAGTIPLNIGSESNESTGRIMTCMKKGEHSFGDIILIQNNEITGVNSTNNKKIISVHNNVYSFLRSQFHTIDALNEKEKNLRRIYDLIKSTIFGLQNNTKTSADISLAIIRSQVKNLQKFRGYNIENAISQLKMVEGIDLKKDTAKISIVLQHLDKKIRKIISQKTSISKHFENIERLIHSSEKSWSFLRKNFRELIKKIEKSKPTELVNKFMPLKESFKKSFSGVDEDLIFKIGQSIEKIIEIDLDKEAKTQAYFWSQDDEKRGIGTERVEYQEHQYFEALNQKRDYYKKEIDDKGLELDFTLKANKTVHQKDMVLTMEKIINLLKVFIDMRGDFCPYPYSYIYEIVLHEKRRLEKSVENQNPIESYRALLSLLITIKEYDILVFISKLEGNRNIEKISTNNEIKNRFLNTIDAKIDNLMNKDFLVGIDFSKESTIDKKFNNYSKNLHKIKAFVEKGEHEELLKYLGNLKIDK